MTRRPLWLFDSPLLRQALAQVNLSAVPAIVRAACGLSQRDLAAVVGWSPAALSYYERGARDGMFDIRMALQFADAVGMPRAALVPLLLPDPDAGLAGAMTRVNFSLHDCGCQAVAAEAAVLSPGSVPRAVSSSHVRYWRACTDVLYARNRAAGGTILLPSAVQLWKRVRLAVKQSAGGEPSCQLLAVAAELALCIGCVALDAGRLRLARRLHAEAQELVAGAGDGVLGVHALVDESLLHAEMARAGAGREAARQALRLAFQAQEVGRYLPVPKLHALIALRHASAAALLGDKAAFQTAVTHARRELDRGPRDAHPPEWLRFVNDTEITGAEARGYLDLGDAGQSAVLYRQVMTSELSPQHQASYGAGLAVALLEQGDRCEAVAAAIQALPALEAGVTSIRCLGQLRLIRRAAGAVDGAQEFSVRFDVIDRALTASLPGDDASPQTWGSAVTSPVSPLGTGTAASVAG